MIDSKKSGRRLRMRQGLQARTPEIKNSTEIGEEVSQNQAERLYGERVWRITQTTKTTDKACGTRKKEGAEMRLTKTKLGEKCGRDDEVIIDPDLNRQPSSFESMSSFRCRMDAVGRPAKH
jgi:hypothetical protein